MNLDSLSMNVGVSYVTKTTFQREVSPDMRMTGRTVTS